MSGGKIFWKREGVVCFFQDFWYAFDLFLFMARLHCSIVWAWWTSSSLKDIICRYLPDTVTVTSKTTTYRSTSSWNECNQEWRFRTFGSWAVSGQASLAKLELLVLPECVTWVIDWVAVSEFDNGVPRKNPWKVLRFYMIQVQRYTCPRHVRKVPFQFNVHFGERFSWRSAKDQ